MTSKNRYSGDLSLNNVRKKIFNKRKQFNAKTVLSAVAGEPMALMEIIDAYEPYIKKLSIRVFVDDNGNCKEEIDETVKRTLETTLIAAILKFNPFK